MSEGNPTAAILIIGNEILSGRTQDVNVQFLARQLAAIGHRLEEVRVVPDVPERIIQAVNELRASYDNVFTTGGIGPTHDDITSECVAAAFGLPLEKHHATWSMLANRLGENFNASRQRMAMMPKGAKPIKNQISIAPGFSIGNVHVMAGVPNIMQSMFLSLVTELNHGVPILMRAVHGVGVREGSIAAGLGAIQEKYSTLDLGSYPFYGANGLGVAIVAKGTDPEALEAAIREAGALIAAQGITAIPGEPAP